MLPHDELYHYGVKGMKWGDKKKEGPLNSTAEELSAMGYTTDEIRELQNKTWNELSPEMQKKVAMGPVISLTNIQRTAHGMTVEEMRKNNKNSKLGKSLRKKARLARLQIAVTTAVLKDYRQNRAAYDALLSKSSSKAMK